MTLALGVPDPLVALVDSFARSVPGAKPLARVEALEYLVYRGLGAARLVPPPDAGSWQMGDYHRTPKSCPACFVEFQSGAGLAKHRCRA